MRARKENGNKKEKQIKNVTKVGAYMATQIVAGICAGMTSLAVFGDAIPLSPGNPELSAEICLGNKSIFHLSMRKYRLRG